MKHCPRCKQTKEISTFAKNSYKKDGLQTWCRECKKEIDKKYYKSHSAEMKLAIKIAEQKRVDKTSQQALEYLLAHPCVDCGETDPLVLEFDHIGNKDLAISTTISRGRSWENILREIAKCEIRCANCHRRKTARQLGWRRYILLSKNAPVA